MKIALPFIAVFALGGCATQTFTMQPGGGAVPTEEVTHQFFVSGIGQQQTVDAAAVCGGAGNVASVEAELRPLDIVFGAITFGIYTPRGARVTCAG